MVHHINKTKDKSHMIILIGARKTLDKLQQPFRIKILNNAGIKEIYLNVIKAIQDKHSYHHPQW